MLHSPEADLAIALFNRSVLNQAKFHRVVELLQVPADQDPIPPARSTRGPIVRARPAKAGEEPSGRKG